jgi:hypothetical protein
MLTGAPPIRVGDRLFIYYRGLANRHKPYEGKDEGNRRCGGLGLATLRLDGFASLQASYDGGRMTTKPSQFLGSELSVNAKADCGQLCAAVLDAEGQPIPGFTRDECEPMRADRVEHRMTWKENATLESLRGRPIRLQFHLENVRLYSFRIVSANR